jgi:hypothetical protein
MEAEELRTRVFGRRVDGGRAHLVGVEVVNDTASVQLNIADPTGLIIGRIAGDIPAATLPAAGELIGTAMSAAAQADGGTQPARLDRKQRQYPNQGARWTSDEEALLSARFTEGAEVTELRHEFGRSANSIRARLVQLGHLPADEWPAGLGARRVA